MASTERRRSLSLPFAPLFSFRSESKSNDKTPRLRRKLQKVTKSTNEADASRSTDRPPLTHVTDGSFVSIKYEARQPQPQPQQPASVLATRPVTGHGNAVNSPRPGTAVSPSCHGAASSSRPGTATSPGRHGAASSSRPGTATGPSRHSITFGGGQSHPPVTMSAAEKKTQAETQARAMAMIDAQERAQGRPVPPPLILPQSVPRHYPQFHRPHHHQQQLQQQPMAPFSRQNDSAYSFSARHSIAASIVSPPAPLSPMSPPPLSSPSIRSFATSYGLPLSPPRSSSSSISTPPSSACSSDHFPSPYAGRVVPELSHLGRNGGQNHYRGVSGAPPKALDSPTTSVSNASSVSLSQPRRKPKTPVFVIGQLESSSDNQQQKQPQNLSQQCSAALGIQTPPESPQVLAATTTVAAELSLLQSQSSIECIAEQYRALLASRNSMFTDAHSVLEPETEDDNDKSMARQHGRLVPEQRRFMLSPASQRKKETAESVSTTSPLPSPMFSRIAPPNFSKHVSNGNNVKNAKSSALMRSSTPPPQADGLSLQICLDLLTRELSSAVVDRHVMSAGLRGASTTSSAATPALQILVMIEAYERLRDQLVDEARRKRNGSSGQIEAMFSLWLQALYKIHDSLTSASAGSRNDEDGQVSESAYDSAEEQR